MAPQPLRSGFRCLWRKEIGSRGIERKKKREIEGVEEGVGEALGEARGGREKISDLP